MTRAKSVKIHVAPEFAQFLKIEAAKDNRSMIDFSRKVVDNQDILFKQKRKQSNDNNIFKI